MIGVRLCAVASDSAGEGIGLKMPRCNEKHLRSLLKDWKDYYNRGRTHSSLGPGIPDSSVAFLAARPSRHQIPYDQRAIAKPVLGGLHREYRIARAAA